MTYPRLALWLLARIASSERHESLVGDVLEELANGRSRLWMWQQVIGVCGFVVVGHARNRPRLISNLIALAPSAMVLAGAAIAPYGRVLEMWAGIYLVTGTLSLFGHLIASTTLDSRALVIPADSD